MISVKSEGWGWGVPVTELEAGRACKAISGWDVLWLWRTCICWALDIPCWLPSAWLGGASEGCWEGAEAVGRCGGLIFSAISCSLILLIKTRLSSWQPGNNICDKRTAISSVSVLDEVMVPSNGWCVALYPKPPYCLRLMATLNQWTPTFLACGPLKWRNAYLWPLITGYGLGHKLLHSLISLLWRVFRGPNRYYPAFLKNKKLIIMQK